MICFSGVRIEPSSKFPQFNGVPGLTDIALGLGRMPRFAGQTRRWWTGLHHSLVCCAIGEALAPAGRSSDRLALLCLLHDAHEAITGDVPAFFKSKELSAWQEEIDERLFKAFGLWPISLEEHEFIKKVDNIALRAEANVLGPPNIMCHLLPPTDGEEDVVQEVLNQFPTPECTDGIDSPAAREFYELFAGLIGESVHNRRDDTPQTRKD